MEHDKYTGAPVPRMRMKKDMGIAISVEFCATNDDGKPDYSKDMGFVGLYDGMLVEAYIARLKQTIKALEEAKTDIFVSP